MTEIRQHRGRSSPVPAATLTSRRLRRRLRARRSRLLPAQRRRRRRAARPAAAGAGRARRALVVDVGDDRQAARHWSRRSRDAPLLTRRDDLFPVVVGTHPHEDHIGGHAGVPRPLRRRRARVWEPGYYHPSASYMETMRALEDTAGDPALAADERFTRFIGQVRVVVLSPAISLRNRFDSYGVTINNASIALKIEFPASRVEQRGPTAATCASARRRRCCSAPTHRRSRGAQVMSDFAELRAERLAGREALRMALGSDPLRAQVFKVPHHALQARGQPRARGADQAGADPDLVGRRGRRVQLPAHGRAGVGARGARGDRRRPARRTGPTTSSASTTPARATRTAGRSARSRSSSRRPAASGASGASATGRRSRCPSGPGGCSSARICPRSCRPRMSRRR